MVTISLSTLANPLISIGRALAPLVKQLRAERQAGTDSTNVKTSLLDAPLEETLNRLQDIESHDSWWRELLQRVESAYVRPDYLAKPSIRDWLSEAAVRDAISHAATRCCCASCRPQRNHARACPQRSHATIRFWRDARSPPREAIAMAGLP